MQHTTSFRKVIPMNKRFLFLLVAALLVEVGLAAAPGAVMAQAPGVTVTAEQVDAAIEKGVKFLWSRQQPTGLWTSTFNWAGNTPYVGGDEVLDMCVMAYAGEPLTKPEMKKGLKALMELNLDKTYTLGFRIITLAELYRRADAKLKVGLRMAMKIDADKLVSYQIADGGWDYTKGTAFDFSNTQMAVLALQQAVSCGVEINPQVFIKSLELYLSKQFPDGGWGYGRVANPEWAHSYGSMTAAAVASLLLMADVLNPAMGCPCKGDTSGIRHMPKVEEAAKRGIKWLGEKFDNDGSMPNVGIAPFYWFYAVERVGIATGYKYLGPHDWYSKGAAKIIGMQAADGSFGPTPATALAVLFLIKGRGPILMNKLQFDGEWNPHPHDAERLTEYVSAIKEQRFNWQIITFEVSVEQMHDAPILYISAETPLKLSDEQKQKLRAFTDTGGTILFEASCGNRAVDAAWKQTCLEIWPEWELGLLDKDHPLWTADAKIGNSRPILNGASDGTRTFLFYSPRDISCIWNTMGVAKNLGSFDLGGNLYAYTTDRGKQRGKLAVRETGFGKKYAEQRLSRGTLDTVTVARVKHGGDWYVAQNYHPWQFLAGQFQVQSGLPAPVAADVGLSIKEGKPLAPGDPIPAGTTMLYLSGRTGCELGANGGQWLKTFAASGGFIFAEAVMGDKRFDEVARASLQAAGFTLKTLGTDSPLLAGQFANGARGFNVTRVGYTFGLRPERIGQASPVLMGLYLGEKLVGVYSPFDVLFSSTGSAAFGNRGYAVEDARAIAANIVLLATSGAAAPAPVEPATASPPPAVP
jgi:hypothetical protein